MRFANKLMDFSFWAYLPRRDKRSMWLVLQCRRFPFLDVFSAPHSATVSTSQKTRRNLSSTCSPISSQSDPCAMTDTCTTSVSITISLHSPARMSRTPHGSAISGADSTLGSSTSACWNPWNSFFHVSHRLCCPFLIWKWKFKLLQKSSSLNKKKYYKSGSLLSFS